MHCSIGDDAGPFEWRSLLALVVIGCIECAWMTSFVVALNDGKKIIDRSATWDLRIALFSLSAVCMCGVCAILYWHTHGFDDFEPDIFMWETRAPGVASLAAFVVVYLLHAGHHHHKTALQQTNTLKQNDNVVLKLNNEIVAAGEIIEINDACGEHKDSKAMLTVKVNLEPQKTHIDCHDGRIFYYTPAGMLTVSRNKTLFTTVMLALHEDKEINHALPVTKEAVRALGRLAVTRDIAESTKIAYEVVVPVTKDRIVDSKSDATETRFGEVASLAKQARTHVETTIRFAVGEDSKDQTAKLERDKLDNANVQVEKAQPCVENIWDKRKLRRDMKRKLDALVEHIRKESKIHIQEATRERNTILAWTNSDNFVTGVKLYHESDGRGIVRPMELHGEVMRIGLEFKNEYLPRLVRLPFLWGSRTVRGVLLGVGTILGSLFAGLGGYMGKLFREHSVCKQAVPRTVLMFDLINYVVYGALTTGARFAVSYVRKQFLDPAVEECQKVSNLKAMTNRLMLDLRLVWVLLHQHVYAQWTAFAPVLSAVLSGAMILDGAMLYSTLNRRVFLGGFWWYALGMVILGTAFVLLPLYTSLHALCHELEKVENMPRKILMDMQDELESTKDHVRFLCSYGKHVDGLLEACKKPRKKQKQQESAEQQKAEKESDIASKTEGVPTTVSQPTESEVQPASLHGKFEQRKKEVEECAARCTIRHRELQDSIHSCSTTSAIWADVENSSPCALHLLPGILPKLMLSTKTIKRLAKFHALVLCIVFL